MKTTTIPEQTRKAAGAIERECRGQIGCNVPVPAVGIEAVTGGARGKYKPGIRCWVIGAEERTVFLGEDCVETRLPEFALVLESGHRFFGQLKRDFEFAT